MEVVLLQAFVSLALVALAVLLFVRSVRARDMEHGDRLALLPVEADESCVLEGAQVLHAGVRVLRAVAKRSANSPTDRDGTPVAKGPTEEDPQ